jgi:2-succinyl-5-enolpyruvyl-6-hydroxy-3-cyclohexene-1-carboxylate synthase
VSVAAANTVWCRALADEMARSGVVDVCLSPGSRSTPLVLAFAADGRFRLRVHLDERSSAFFALGVGKASGRPAVVITTSGTAAANVYPAVVEAAQAEVPLIVLTADRPHRLRGADANQTIDQVRLYGSYPRSFHDLAPPTLDPRALRHLRTLVCRTVADAVAHPAGPVHLNLPFDKPFEPEPAEPGSGASEPGEAATGEAATGEAATGEAAPGEAATELGGEDPLALAGRPDGDPFVRVGTAVPRASDEEIGAVAELMNAHPRGILVAGPSPRPDETAEAVARLAAATGYPLLADPLSGARYGPSHGAVVVAAYDLFLRNAEVRERLTPELIVRVGASPTSAALQKCLFHWSGVRHVVMDPAGRWKGHGAVETDYVKAHAGDACHRLESKVAPPALSSWQKRWWKAGEAARAALSQGSLGDESRVAAALTRALPAEAVLFVSSSMPIRDVDAFGLPRHEPLRVLGNRGASGIDGVVSSAFGAAAATGRPTVCLVGDLAFFHDQNGMLWSRETDADVVFVLVDNDGGGIFHMLPVRDQEPHFTPLFATPHGLDFRHVAELHGIALDDVAAEDVPEAVGRALEAGGTRIVRVSTQRDAEQRARGGIAESVGRSVLQALG